MMTSVHNSDAPTLERDGKARSLRIPSSMTAACYADDKSTVPIVRRVPTPRILRQTDAIVRVHKTTICGTDLHIMRGAVPECKKFTTLGHEGIGDIVAIGSEVKKYKIGDRVLVPCITRCGKCAACKNKFYGHCDDGGWILGHTINGMQAEYARIPHVDASCYRLPSGVCGDEENAYVMLSDILPTGLEVGLIDGGIKEGMTIGFVGMGPVGLASLMIATQMFKPKRVIAIDINKSRLEVASSFGATDVIDNSNGDADAQIMKLTDNVGLDLVVECIGIPEGWYICQNIVRAGGSIAILGVHGKSATINLERMWYRNFRMTAGMVHCFTIDMIMEKIRKKELLAHKLINGEFKMSDLRNAYYTFANADKTGSLKVIIENDLGLSARSAL